MISATYFGEITELDSRAVWYSDEEDDDDDEEGDVLQVKPNLRPIIPLTHETFRSNIQLNFQATSPNLNLKFTKCVVSLSSSSQFKNLKLGDITSLLMLGSFDSIGKVFAFPNNKEVNQNSGESEDYLLWLLFDSSNPYISGHEVGYFVENLREKLQNEFNLNRASQILILSQTFSNSEHLEYLSNFGNNPTMKPPFSGRPLMPPSLIKNQFESALFEQLTLSLIPAFVLCLPNPKDFWFDKTNNWPTVPDQIIEHKLNDDNLEKTLIFT